MSKSNSSRPTHEVFAVKEREGKKSNWMRIGGAWKHQDGNGMNMRLDALPLNGASIVIRVRSEKPEANQTDAEAGAA